MRGSIESENERFEEAKAHDVRKDEKFAVDDVRKDENFAAVDVGKEYHYLNGCYLVFERPSV
jgi:hypothetical protein